MKFLSPKILGYRSFHTFARNHLVYSDKYPGQIVRSLRADVLAERIQPYTYQVTKEECLDLPSKLYERRYCALTREQDDWYERAKNEILAWLDDDHTGSAVAIFTLFGALQQIVCGFWNRRDYDTGEVEHIEMSHHRDDVLLAAVADIPPGEQVIIWSKFHYSIDQIVAALRREYGEAATAEFHGRLSEKARHAQLDRWRADADCRFLVATQASGGHGLTLNEASYVVFYSNEFKYSTRIQAEDRCHRIGQTRPVTYIDIICSGSIDTRIDEALRRKANAAAEFRAEVDRVKDDRQLMKEMIQAL